MDMIHPEFTLAYIFSKHMGIHQPFVGLYIQQTPDGIQKLLKTDKNEFNQIINLDLIDYIKLPRKPIAAFEQPTNYHPLPEADCQKFALIANSGTPYVYFEPTFDKEIENIIYSLRISLYLLDDPTPFNDMIDDYQNDLKIITNRPHWRETINRPRLAKALNILFTEVSKTHNIKYTRYD